MITAGTSTVTGRDVQCPTARQMQLDMADLWYACHVLQRSVGNRFGVHWKVADQWWRSYRNWGGTGN